MDTPVWLAVIGLATVALTGPISLLITRILDRKSRAAETAAAENAKRLDAQLRAIEKDEDVARARRERAEDRAAAQELLDNTARAASAAVATESVTKETHVLVNSNYTAALEATCSALQAKLVVLLDSVAYKKEHGTEPSPQVLTDIEVTGAKIDALRTQIDERLERDKATAEQKKKDGAQPAVLSSATGTGLDPLRSAGAIERTAAASERAASAAERSADAAESKK